MSDAPFKAPSSMGGYVEPHRATLILVLGILGLVACQPLGIAAWLMGAADLKKMQAGVMDRSGESTTQIGYVLGIVSSILLIFGCLIGIVWVFVAFVIMAGAAGGAAMQN
jgi:hypothetical protein